MKDPLEVLKENWGYPSFRSGQREIIDRVLRDENLLALLPTGGGKSLCYQVPALCREGITIVISPLISLMQDQVQALKKKNINAEAIYSGLSYSMIDAILDNCIYGDIKMLYVSPERLQTELFLERLQQMKVNLIAVDEAHCISQWGYDFRPAYLNIQDIREILPDIQIIALTATAPPEVATDICTNLGISDESIFKGDFRRSNLSFLRAISPDKEQKLYQMINSTNGATIIYCRRRNQTENIASSLQKRGMQALAYHAGISSKKRMTIQKDFMQGKVRTIAATTAFGMGVDKADVRYVYHMEPPMSPEEYFQEAGRAGRDGKKAWCVLFYNDTDKETLLDRHDQSYPPLDFIEQLYRSLAIFYRLAYGSGGGESFEFDIDAFCRRFNYGKIKVYYALKFIEHSAWITLSEGIHQPSRLRIIMNRNDLYNQQLRDDTLDAFIRYLLRTYEGLFTNFVVIHEVKIARELEVEKRSVIDYLHKLNDRDILEYQESGSAPKITFIEPIVRQENFRLDEELYHFLRERSLERIEAMVNFAEAEECREEVMLHYFGQAIDEECGNCDVCMGSLKRIPDEDEKRLIVRRLRSYLKMNRSWTVPQIIDMFPIVFRRRVVYSIDRLEDNGWLAVDSNQTISKNGN